MFTPAFPLAMRESLCRSILWAVSLTVVILSAACQSLPPRPDAEALPKIPTLSAFREQLTESGALFYEGVNLMSDDQLSPILAELNKLAWAPKGRFDRASVLRMADDSATFGEGPGKVTAAKARKEFVQLLGDSALSDILNKRCEVEKDRIAFCRDKHPRIHNIGLQNFLTFEAQPEGGREPTVSIPFDGRDLYPCCVNVDVMITGVVPVSGKPSDNDYEVFKPRDDRTDGGNSDSGNIVLQKPLLNRLKSRDRLTVQIVVSERRAFKGDDKRIVSYATRTFTMYDVNDYRTNILKNQVPLQDIRAFPLPASEVEKLFGSLIAKHFFVIRLSIMNRESEAKLVSTGMIAASGRVIVEPDEVGSPSFTVPVTIVPSSLQQTYTILDDEEVDQPRSVAFRALEFVGALGSAATAAFSSSRDLVKGIGLLTGVFIPESKKLVPDRWPGYKRNVVNFAAPDLLKVPANSPADHKLLFFSKRDIELLIADQNLFTKGKLLELPTRRPYSSFWPWWLFFSPPGPKVRILSIAFDTLDIRFEKVFDAGKLTVRQRVPSLVASLPQRIDQLNGLDSQWSNMTNPNRHFGETVLTYDVWNKLNAMLIPDANALKKLYTDALGKLPPTDKNELESVPPLSQLIERMTVVVKVFDPKGDIEGYRQDLVASPAYGLKALRELQPKINDLTRTLAAGLDPAEADLTAIEAVLENNRKALDFYTKAAQLLANNDVFNKLTALREAAQEVVGKNAANDAKTKFKKAAVAVKATLDRELTNLQKLRPDGSLNLMSGVLWPQITEKK